MPMKFGVFQAFASLAFALFTYGIVIADETNQPRRPSKSSSSASNQSELFTALENKTILVRFIPIGPHKATVIITNNSDQTLDLELPAAFGAVPVLAQLGGPGGGFQGGGFQGGGGFPGGGGFQGGGGFPGGGGGQGLGGGFGGGNIGGLGGGGLGGGGFGGGNLGGGMFRIEPQKTRKLTVPCVCLEYGKPDPTPRMKYQIVPLEQVNDSPAIQALCAALGSKQVNQVVAQAAAWNLANGLNWEQLKNINRVESQLTGNERFFTIDQLSQAARVVEHCQRHSQTHYVTSDSTSADSRPRSSSSQATQTTR